MKWRNTSFKYRDTAERCRKELIEAGIEVGKIFLDNGYYYTPWMPMSRSEYETGVQIVCKYIW